MYRKKLQGWWKHLDFIIMDLLLLELAFVFAYMLRFQMTRLVGLQFYRNDMLLIALFALVDDVLLDGCKDILRRGYLVELGKTIRLIVTVILLLTFSLYALKAGATLSRKMVIYFIIFGTLMVYVARCLRKYWLWHHRFTQGYSIRQLLIVADKDNAEQVIKQVQENTYRDVRIAGLIDADGRMKIGDEVGGTKVVATFDTAQDYMIKRWIDEVLIAQNRHSKEIENFIDQCLEMGITTHERLDMGLDRHQGTKQIENFCGYTVITESMRVVSTLQVVLKRLTDIIGSIVGLAFTAIFTIIIGPIIFFTDPGPIFYSQVRIGKNGRRFKIYKFRSMYKDADKRKKELMSHNQMQGLMFKMDNDPRILGSGPDGTKHGIGWFIRKTSIDEFPQFLNVFLGQMSLVGTRPPTEGEFSQYEAHHRARLAVKPGITGLWQVSGRSKITDFEEVVALDTRYINTWTIGEDIKILLKTVKVVFAGDGAQ